MQKLYEERLARQQQEKQEKEEAEARKAAKKAVRTSQRMGGEDGEGFAEDECDDAYITMTG